MFDERARVKALQLRKHILGVGTSNGEIPDSLSPLRRMSSPGERSSRQYLTSC
ncbi:hypothetical protein OKW30_005621 [Paraburkholderia sp. Clong3]